MAQVDARIVLTGVAVLLTAAILLFVSGRPSVWTTMRPATCLPADCFCEAVREQLVRQPVNALSGLSFVFVGLTGLFRRRRRFHTTSSVTDGERAAEVLLAGAAVLLGLGTVFYHASLTFVGQTVDVFGMYLLVTIVGLSVITRRWSLSGGVTAALGVVINAILLAVLIAAPDYRRLVFAGLVVLVIALEARARPLQARGGRKVFWWAAAILAGGFLVWVLDYTAIVCAPNSWLQGHAVWHLCGAAAVWLTMKYYAAGDDGRITALT